VGRCILALLAVALLHAGTEPKPAASAYPSHAALERGAIGAEYHVRSVPGQGESFLTSYHLVIEVALYPARGTAAEVTPSQFTLRLNGAKRGVYPVSVAEVAASLKYEDWERRPELTAAGGTNEGGIVWGRTRTVERFPGDQRPAQQRLPAPPRAPDANPKPAETETREKPEAAVVRLGLESGAVESARSGLLYFYFKGKARNLKRIELDYEGPLGKVTLRLK
jgi:hypothetical protein